MSDSTAGIVMIVIGILVVMEGRIPIGGNLPGDLHFHGKNWHIFVPLGTCLAASVIVWFVLRLIAKR